MKSQISLAFEKCKKEKRPALLTYTVAGDNTKEKSLKILKDVSFLKMKILLFLINGHPFQLREGVRLIFQ